MTRMITASLIAVLLAVGCGKGGNPGAEAVGSQDQPAGTLVKAEWKKTGKNAIVLSYSLSQNGSEWTEYRQIFTYDTNQDKYWQAYAGISEVRYLVDDGRIHFVWFLGLGHTGPRIPEERGTRSKQVVYYARTDGPPPVVVATMSHSSISMMGSQNISYYGHSFSNLRTLAREDKLLITFSSQNWASPAPADAITYVSVDDGLTWKQSMQESEPRAQDRSCKPVLPSSRNLRRQR